MNEEDKFKIKLKEELMKTIDRVFDKFMASRDYYLIRIELIEKSIESNYIAKREVIIDEYTEYCVFCGKETNFYYDKFEGNVCAECLGKYLGGKNEKK